MDRFAIGIEFMGALMTTIILVACLAENRILRTIDRYLIVLYEVTIIMNLYAGFQELLHGTSLDNFFSSYVNSYIERLMVVIGIAIYSVFVFSYFKIIRSKENLLTLLLTTCVVAGAFFLGTGQVALITPWILLIMVLAVDGVLIVREGQKSGQYYYLVLLTYCIAPIIGVILAGGVYFPAIHIAFDLSVFAIYVAIHVEQGIRMEEKEKTRLQAIAEIEKNQKYLMISQIQPHFIYNSLNAIYYLTEEDPELAQNAISDFSDYLRMNFDSFEEVHLVPIRKELDHIKTYLMMEKIRFEDQLNFEFDIQEEDFEVPALSIQPLVENAVNHGLSQKNNGGMVRISTRRDKNWFVILVEDNGVGMTAEEIQLIDKNHSGISLVREQIETMCQGEVHVQSVINQGTQVEVCIPIETTPTINMEIENPEMEGE